jgi:hypothetical protein
MARAPINRRHLLRGFLRGSLVSVALPPLEAFFNSSGTAYACGGAIPRRFALFYWGNGNNPNYWVPTGEGEGDEWSLSTELASLAAIKHKLSVVSGMAVKVPNTEAHLATAAGMLSGAPLQAVGTDFTFMAPSIDQVIAAELGDDSIFRSIQTGATNNSGMSYNGPSSKNPPETSPYALYELIFGSTFREPGEEGVVDPRLGLRQSVLDAVMADTAALRKRVGAADAARLDQHLDGIRDLEQRLARLQEDPPNLEACTRPSEPLAEYPDIDGRPQISAVSRAMCDLLVMALACDQTRVVSHYLTDPVSNVLFPGASAGHHNLTHDEPGDQPEVHAITSLCVEEYAYLLGAMDAVPEADGTLLDNCAVLGTTDVSKGQTHSGEDMPILIGGSACGALRTGLHYRSYTSENVSKVLLTLIRSMDITASDFGQDEGYVTDGLADIEA